MQDEGGGRRRWSALEILVAGETVVVVLVLAFAWWPVDSDAQSPLGFAEGLRTAGAGCLFTLPFLALFAAAVSARHETARWLFGILLGLLSGLVTFVVVSLTAFSRLEDQHEA